MIRQKPLLGIRSCNLIRHPYIALETQCVSGRTFSQNDLKNVRCQTVVIVSVGHTVTPLMIVQVKILHF